MEGRFMIIVLLANVMVCSGQQASGPVALVIAVSVVILILFVLLVAVIILLCRTRLNENKSGSYPAVASGSDADSKPHVDDVMSMETIAVTPDASGTDVHANVERPGPIAITGLEEYIKEHDSGTESTLEQQFQLLNGEKMFQSDIGEEEENKAKNRFRNMIAYDHSRVELPLIEGDSDSDYYNANYIKDHQGNRVFIACQGPNKASVDDFWRMIWQENVTNIVMLTNLIEKGKDRCMRYWPASVETTELFGNIQVHWKKTEQFAEYEVRELNICPREEEARTVLNWHFQTWPDMSTPDQPTALIAFAKRVKIAQRSSAGPLTVHCSAGVGRTGTFIGLYTLMDVMETKDVIDVYGCVERMREDRIMMVQTAKQFKFLHLCLLECYLSGNPEIPAAVMTTFDIEAAGDKLSQQFKLLAKLDMFSKYGQSAPPEDPTKCRHPSLVPVEKMRPYLQSQGKTSQTNFINACFTSSYRSLKAFIATQSPLQNTVEDFWRLVFDWKCPLIVMLNELDESCCQYWPDSGTATYGNMTVTLKEERDLPFYRYRLFDVEHALTQNILAVHHMQLTSSDQLDTLRLIRSMERLQHDHSMDSPITIHCENGVGRTGVFLTVLSEMDRIKTEGRADVFNSVRQLRESSHHLVLTEDDYVLCHTLLKMDQPEPEYGNI